MREDFSADMIVCAHDPMNYASLATALSDQVTEGTFTRLRFRRHGEDVVAPDFPILECFNGIAVQIDHNDLNPMKTWFDEGNRGTRGDYFLKIAQLRLAVGAALTDLFEEALVSALNPLAAIEMELDHSEPDLSRISSAWDIALRATGWADKPIARVTPPQPGDSANGEAQAVSEGAAPGVTLVQFCTSVGQRAAYQTALPDWPVKLEGYKQRFMELHQEASTRTATADWRSQFCSLRRDFQDKLDAWHLTVMQVDQASAYGAEGHA